jgi:hypothetical protein
MDKNVIKKIIILILLLLVLAGCRVRKLEKSESNLDFETVEWKRPVDWKIIAGSGYDFESVEWNIASSGYKIIADSLIRQNGKYSVSVKYERDGQLTYQLPNYYKGKKITLSGYIKTENITGEAELLMKLSPPATEKVNNQKITGTNDWKKYTTSLKLNPSRRNRVMVGGLFKGKGQIWFDDFRITIDGKDLSKVKSYKEYPIFSI